MVGLAEGYREKTGTQYLCVAGGVFLNVFLVRALEERAGFARIFVQPVTGNAGTALGAAYLARKRVQPEFTREPLTHLYLGPKLDGGGDQSGPRQLQDIYRYLPSEKQLVEETARLLPEDKIVAWCQVVKP